MDSRDDLVFCIWSSFTHGGFVNLSSPPLPNELANNEIYKNFVSMLLDITIIPPFLLLSIPQQWLRERIETGTGLLELTAC
jgi:hypothetical protein